MKCRCCLRELPPDAEPMWGGQQAFGDMLAACMGRPLLRGSGLPEFLCHRCARRLPHAWRFLHLCRRTDRHLRVLHQSQCPPEEASEPEPDLDAGQLSNPPSDIEYSPPKPPVYNCNLCEYTAETEHFLKEHILSFHKCEKEEAIDKYLCKVCGKEFKRKTDLKVHFRVHSGEKPYSCEHCPMRFRQSGTLLEHTRSHTGEKPFACNFCSKAFRSRSSFWRHRLVHTKERPHSCDVCGRSFAHSTSLKHHRTVHTEERPFSCDVCGKTLKTKLALKQHMIVHSNTIYVCDQCGKKFTMKGSLKKHIKNMHSEGAGRCPYCKKDTSDLKQHLLIHSDQMTYQCHLCEKSFKQKNNLSFHITLHKNADKYKCEVDGCTQVFPKKNMLEFHFHKIHSNETPHICQYCSKGYIRISDLSRHLNMFHSEYAKKV